MKHEARYFHIRKKNSMASQPIALLGEVIDSGTFCRVRAIVDRTDVVAKVYTHKYQCERTLRALALIDHVARDSQTLSAYRHYIEEVLEASAHTTRTDMGNVRVSLYVIMPKYDINFGKYLRDYVRENNTGLPSCITLKLARELFRALCVLETARVIHGDIKPSNIMVRARAGAIDLEVTTSYEFVLCDFGSARILDDGQHEYHPAVVGTNGYMAPEIMLGLGYSHPADVWSAMTTIMTSIIGCEIFDATNHDDMDYGYDAANAFASTFDVDGEDDDSMRDTSAQGEDSTSARECSDSLDSTGVGFAQMYAMVVEMYVVIGSPPDEFCAQAREFYTNGAPRYHPNLQPGTISSFIGNNCTLNPQHARSIDDFVSMGLQYMPRDRATVSDIVTDAFLSEQ